MSEHKRNKNNRSGNQLLKTGMVWTILLAALVAVFILSIAIGSSGYPLSEVTSGPLGYRSWKNPNYHV